MEYKNQTKLYDFGNRCGHNPIEPRFYARPPHKKNTFDVINIAQSKMKKFYYHPEEIFPNFQAARDVMAYKKGKEKGSRQRSESREAVAILAQCMLDHSDLHSLRCVKIKEGKMVDLTLPELAKKAKLSQKRTERAFKTLKDSRYIIVDYQTHFNRANELVKVPAIKRLSANLFYDMGISAGKLERCRNFHNKNGTTPIKFTSDQCRQNLEKLAIIKGSIAGEKRPKNVATDTKGYYSVNEHPKTPTPVSSILSNLTQKKEIDQKWVKLSKAADAFSDAVVDYYRLNEHRIDLEGAKSFVRSKLGGRDPEAELLAYIEWDSKKRTNC